MCRIPPSWPLRPFVFSLRMVSGPFRSTHPSGWPVFVGLPENVISNPASLSGLSGPMVMNHSCGSSWQGRMRRRTIEPALSSEQDTTSEHRISFSCYRGPFRSRTIFRRIAGPRPRLVLSGRIFFVVWGEAPTSFTGCEPTCPSGLPLPFLTTCNFVCIVFVLNRHSEYSSRSGPSFYPVGSGRQLGGVVTSQQLNMVHRSPSYLCEQTRRVVLHLIAQHVVGCPGELMA